MWIYGVHDADGQDMPLEVRVFGPKKEAKEMTADEKAAQEKSKATKRKVAIGIAGATAALGAILFGVSKVASKDKQTPAISSGEDNQGLLETDSDSDAVDETVNEQETDEEL